WQMSSSTDAARDIRIPHETVNDDLVTVQSWAVAHGARVSPGQVVVHIETSKAVLEIEAETADTCASCTARVPTLRSARSSAGARGSLGPPMPRPRRVCEKAEVTPRATTAIWPSRARPAR